MDKPRYRRSRKDYPQGVIGIYDNGGMTFDRYTVVYEPEFGRANWYFPYVAMNGKPFHPLGFGQYGETVIRITRLPGEKVIDFAELPEDCQRLVYQDLEI